MGKKRFRFPVVSFPVVCFSAYHTCLSSGNDEKNGTSIVICSDDVRGQGVASFRAEVAKGMAEAAKEMHDASLDSTFLLFSMWTEAVKHFGETGKGNVIFLDGSTEGMKRTMQQMMSMNVQDLKDKV